MPYRAKLVDTPYVYVRSRQETEFFSPGHLALVTCVVQCFELPDEHGVSIPCVVISANQPDVSTDPGVFLCSILMLFPYRLPLDRRLISLLDQVLALFVSVGSSPFTSLLGVFGRACSTSLWGPRNSNATANGSLDDRIASEI